MSKKNILIIVPIIFLLTLISCSKQSNQPTQNKTLTLGMILPLTGDFSFFGQQAKEGALIAQQEINQNSDTKINIIFEDERCQTKDALNAYLNLKNLEQVNFIIGPACTDPILTVAQKLDQPILAILDAGEEIEKASTYLYSLGYSSEQEGYLIAEYLIKNNLKTAGIIYDQDSWASLVKDSFKQKYKSLGGKILIEESHNTENNDYRTDILKVVEHKPQALFITPAYNGGYVLKQLKELQINIPIFGPDTLGINEVLAIAGQAAEDIIFANVMVDENSPGAIKFQEKYTAQHSQPSGSLTFVALGYDSIKIIHHILTHYPNNIPQGFSQINYTSGIISVHGFDQNGMAKLEPILMTVKDQKFIPLN